MASDLSPYYLSAARDNLGYWKRTRQPGARLGPGPFEAGTKFLQCPAEAVPDVDESFDAVRGMHIHVSAACLRPAGLSRPLQVSFCFWARRPRFHANTASQTPSLRETLSPNPPWNRPNPRG